MMALAQLIVCETTSKWAVALRRQLPGDLAGKIRETRHLEDCWQEALASPASLVAVEVTWLNLKQAATAVQQFRTRLPRTRLVIVGSRELESVQWLMRELGAVHAVFSTRTLAPMIRMAQRHWANLPAEASAETAPPWRRLPWGGWDKEPVAKIRPEPTWLLDTGR